MKNPLFLFLLLSLFSFFAKAQNLVPNPSFEDTVHCPTNQGQVVNAKGWWSVCQTPDYFNECAPNGNLANVPNTLFGHKFPSSGHAFIGGQQYFTSLTREIIGTKLDTSLTIGQRYYCKMKVSIANGGLLGASGFCNNFGMKFTIDAFSQANPIAINNFAQIVDTTIIRDTVGWTLIQGSFVADSAYKYLSIGNFFDNAHTDTDRILNGWLRVYYCVDEVSVCTDSTCLKTVGGIANISSDNSVSVYPNPANTEINIKTNGIQIEQIEIFNALGQNEKTIFHPPIQTITTLDVSQLNIGIHLLKIKTKEGNYSKKIKIIH